MQRLEDKTYHIVQYSNIARPKSRLGHLWRFGRPLIASAITLTADIRMRCNI